MVKIKHVKDYLLLLHNVKLYNIVHVESCEFDERTYLITINPTQKNSMQIANELYETGLFEYAEPNLLHIIHLSTSDQYYSQQWALNNMGQNGGTPGIDIKVNQAWNITTGSPTINIAILDVGVDLTHPDLVNNLLSGFDATGNGSAGAPINNTGDDAHGTACAGIVAAQAHNTIGIAGVAYNCRILPVRIATRSNGWTTTESQYIANGINWATQNNARIISMSFGCIATTSLNTIINNVANSGCLLIAASGNDYMSSVSYPASLSNVIAVGAINRNGQRADFSNYGTALDVVAPGIDIYTTDIQGNAGYNTSSNYYASFEGTSAACPHIAGVAALILSIRPDLTQAQVRQAIESTCTKLSGYSYTTNSNHPNSTWNSEVGYGLVDAYAAVLAVSISGPGNPYSIQQVTYTANYIPANTTVTWSGSSSVNFIGGQSGESVTISICGSGAATLTATMSGALTDTLSRTFFVSDGYLTTIPGPGYIDVSYYHPYAQCYDWVISTNFTSEIGNGTITCNNAEILTLEPVDSNTYDGYIQVWAQANGCYSPWRAEEISIWHPEIDNSNSYLNPMIGEPFWVNLVEPVPDNGKIGTIQYYWYFHDTLFEITDEPYIHSYAWPCGEYQLSVVVHFDDYEMNTMTDFWGMCPYGTSSTAYLNVK